MAKVPMLCTSCERLSVSDSILGGDAPFVQFENVGFGPCPHCGGDCDVLDGSYGFIGETISFLGGPDRTASELKRLASILQEARGRGETVQNIAAEIKRDLPKLSSIVDILPKNRAELYAFIGHILAVISLLLDAAQKGSNSAVTINQVINNIYTEQAIQQRIAPSSTGTRDKEAKSPKLGRNDACHCGSGKKYKRCHGN